MDNASLGATRAGRRRDEILRVVADDPRILGFRPRTVLLAMMVGFFSVALHLAGLFNMFFGRAGVAVCMATGVVTLLVARAVEEQDDANLIPWTARYYLRRYLTRGAVIYCGGKRGRYNQHFLDEVLLVARLSRMGGLPWHCDNN
jgi:hypothetical protein